MAERKLLDDMTEPELKLLMNKVGAAIDIVTGGRCFVALVTDPEDAEERHEGSPQPDRACVIQWLRETADRLESDTAYMREEGPWSR